jgi:hypothetical protein
MPPGAPISDGWRDVRLSTPAGMLTIKRRPEGAAIVTFGNASPELQAAQRTLADALERIG